MGGATKFLMLLAAPFPPRSPSLLRLTRRHHHHYRRHLSSLSSLSVHPHPGLTASHRRTASIAVNCSSQQLHSQTRTIREEQQYFSESNQAAPVGGPHPWPEWLNLLENLAASGYFNEGFGGAVALDSREDEFAADVHLPAEFTPAARACLAFARDRPWLLQTLTRSDIKVLVENGTPFLFKNADDSIRKMRTFLDGDGAMAVDTDRAKTIDLMRFLLSYASSPSRSGETAITNEELIISSVRNLVGQLARQGGSPAALSEPNFSDPIQNSFPGRQGPMSKPRGQNVEMKRGDWLCERCNFMNFARNMKCLECDEARPKRQLTGGEWECPQCCFFNYSRNTACLRCDCKRPGMLPHAGSRYSARNYTQKDVESRLAANEEKAQRWFSKVSKMDSTSDTSSALADEDFPEIMPLRKGVNRFVVSTRKTPLERRLANAEHQRSLGNDANLASSDSRMGNENNNSDSMTSRKLNEILGRKSVDQMNASNTSPEQGRSQGSNSSYSPFVPLPPDMFAKKPANSQTNAGGATEDGNDSRGLDSQRQISSSDGSKNTEREQEEKSERWFKRIAELHDSPDLTTAISDEDFPEIMPVRKGENRFVVSKKKDRSLTSPMYKRQAAMEQARSSNFVPFVPFPPDYFAKKDNQQSGADSGSEAATCFTSSKPNELLENANSSRNGQKMENHRAEPANVENSLREPGNSQTDPGVKNMNETSNQLTSTTGSSSQPLKSYSWTGKSLEGSAVKEPDPLDMSEEAKAERWFRRVAQIKDISELSQIPDEDFPSIMPMRKGVNRFVVSKRKTPLERRLTSSQYRKNLPVVSSDPLKKENDSN